MIRSPDCDMGLFNIVALVFFLFFKRKRISKRYPAETTSDIDDAVDLALLANTQYCGTCCRQQEASASMWTRIKQSTFVLNV